MKSFQTMIITNSDNVAVTGASNGRITCQNTCQLLQLSSRAASSSSSGMAAMKLV